MSEDVAAAVDEEVRRLITAAHEEARQILTTHMDALERLANVLMDKETVDAGDLAEIFHDVPKWEHTEKGSLRIRMPQPALTPDTMVAAQRGHGGESDPS
jgi:cell division protease FtsH